MLTVEARTAELSPNPEQEEDPDVQMLDLKDIDRIRKEGYKGRKSPLLTELDHQVLPLAGAALRRVREGTKHYVHLEFYVDRDPDSVAAQLGGIKVEPHNRPAWAGGGIVGMVYEWCGTVPEDGMFKLDKKVTGDASTSSSVATRAPVSHALSGFGQAAFDIARVRGADNLRR